jgi:2-aminoethylphosphonate-pyruvate transaminase
MPIQARLLTPGPLAIASNVKRSMQTDLGSRDYEFDDVTSSIRATIHQLAGGDPEYTVIPLQGSGTFAIEGALTTFIGPNDKVLVCVNGIYGELALKILRRHGLTHDALSMPINKPVPLEAVKERLDNDPSITHLYFAHCETTSGILNPFSELVHCARQRGVMTIVDAMSAFGAIEINATRDPFDVLISSGNKCLEAPPGIAFAIVRKHWLTRRSAGARTYSLDLLDQWRNFESTGQWRSTPPTHVAQALDAALQALVAEGGVAARRARYEAICSRLIAGMRPLGFEPILPAALQSPICVAFRSERLIPNAAAFATYYAALREAGLVIYARFHESSKSFRIGCIGQIEPIWIDELIAQTAQFVGTRRPAVGAAKPKPRPFRPAGILMDQKHMHS